MACHNIQRELVSGLEDYRSLTTRNDNNSLFTTESASRIWLSGIPRASRGHLACLGIAHSDRNST